MDASKQALARHLANALVAMYGHGAERFVRDNLARSPERDDPGLIAFVEAVITAIQEQL